MTLIEIEELVKEFDTLPKTIRQVTYLELCKYPYRRFEEICSRLLSFYLSPQKEHGFKDLFLRSLLEILEPQKKLYFKFDKIKVICEENAEGRRLDLLVQADTFVIGIENKITAGLYNPLEIYSNRIALYNENIFRVVLSLGKISGNEELALLKDNNFINITYSKYFGQIKNNLGPYINDSNSKYLIFLTDFIQTIENMNGQNILNPQLSDFFYNNSTRVDQLIELYDKFKNEITTIQNERIAYLKEQISAKTKRDWWVWEGWDLGVANFNSLNKPNIGIESHFEASKGNPLGKFIITITTWKLKEWNYYEKIILSKYQNKQLEKKDDRAILQVATIMDNNEELIIETLASTYSYLYDLTRE